MLDMMVRHDIAAYTNPVPTGIAMLDEFLGGGLHRSVILTLGAQAKAGKMTLAAAVSYNLEQGSPPITHPFVNTNGQPRKSASWRSRGAWASRPTR